MLTLAGIWAFIAAFWPVIGVIATVLGLFMDFLGLRTWLTERLGGRSSGGVGRAASDSTLVRDGLILAGAGTALALEIAHHHGTDLPDTNDGIDGHNLADLAGSEIAPLDDLPDLPDAPDHPLGHIGQVLDAINPTN